MPNNFGGDQHDPEYKPRGRVRKAKPKKGPRTPHISQRDARWFKDRHGKVMDENRELRHVVESFARHLDTGSLGEKLLARELRRRIDDVQVR